MPIFSPQKWLFLGVFLDKISFPGHVIHILKAIVPAHNLSYQKRSFEHPTRRQIFANTVGRMCILNLTLRHILFHLNKMPLNLKKLTHSPSMLNLLFGITITWPLQERTRLFCLIYKVQQSLIPKKHLQIEGFISAFENRCEKRAF